MLPPKQHTRGAPRIAVIIEFVRNPDKLTRRLIYRAGGESEHPLDICPGVDFRSVAIASPQNFWFTSQDPTRMVRPHVVPGRAKNQESFMGRYQRGWLRVVERKQGRM